MRRLLFLFALLAAAASASAVGHVQSVEEDADRCLADPRYNIGGAAIGDCLLELSEAVDRDIAAAMSLGEQRYCAGRDKADYRQAQADWANYRKRTCDLVERSPDNTPSWVNAGACRLELGRQRLQALRYTNEYGSVRCPTE